MSFHVFSPRLDNAEVKPCLPQAEGHAPSELWTDDLFGLQKLPVGTILKETDRSVFQIVDFGWIPVGAHNIRCPILQALTETRGRIAVSSQEPNLTLAVLTLSDKGARGLREDSAGPLALAMTASTLNPDFSRLFMLPDEANELRTLLSHLALNCRYDLILTCGGTGISPRDITPQTTCSLLDYTLPGIPHAMMNASLSKTPHAVLSRAVAGVIGRCMIINLPGSKKAVAENLEAVLPALSHGIKKLKGDPTDCGSEA